MRSLLYQYQRRGATPLDASVTAAMGALRLDADAATAPDSAAAAESATAAATATPSTPSAGKPFFCSACNKGYTSARGLKTHTRQVHELRKYGDAWKPER